jgi:hypothetical protein
MLMNKDGAVAKELIAIQNALQPQYKHMSHIIKYEELVTQPKKILQSVYEFLGIEYYPHYFHNLNQFKINGLNYNDTVVGNNMHTIKTEMRLEDNPYKKLIPQNIINKYGHIKL